MDYKQNTNSNDTGDYRAMLDMVFESAGGRTVLSRCQKVGSLDTQPPLYPEGNRNICHAYLIHPPGGVVGGDVLDVQCTLKCGTHAVITTSDKTKFYRCAEHVAVYKQVLTIHPHAELEYIVQENMFFNGCNARVDMLIDCKSGGKFMVWVWHCQGQTANTEYKQNGTIQGKTIVLMNSKPAVAENILFDFDNPITICQQGIEYPVSASFYISNDTPHMLRDIRNIIDAMPFDTSEGICVACLENHVIIIRMFSTTSAITRIAFTKIWQYIRKSRHQSETAIPCIWRA